MSRTRILWRRPGASSRRSWDARRPPGEPTDLGEVRQKSGKRVRAWALAGDLDAATITSNSFTMEWPPALGPDAGVPRGRPGAVVRARRRRGRRSSRPRRSCSIASSRLDGASELHSDSISPTAHYTGYVWARNGLSHPELTTTEGRLLFESLHPLMRVSGALGGPSLEAYLLARHRAIDALLERAIEEHGITQVVEVAAGLSPRGWRFAERYGERHHLHRGRPPGDGGAQAAGAGADRIAQRPPPGARPRRAARHRPGQPGRRSWPSSIRAPGWRSSPRDCWVISRPMTSTALWRRFAEDAVAVSPAGATSPICTSAAPRRSRCGRSGSCSRRSCGAGCTCTSMTPSRPRAELRRAGFADGHGHARRT